LLTRTLHWLNAIAIGALIATGIAMMIGGDWLASIGSSIHEMFYFLLFGVGAIYLITLLAGGAWKQFLPTRETLEDANAVVKSELGMGSHTPRLQKYNGAQRLAYGAVLLMVGGEVVTGLAMAYHDQAPWLAAMLGGRHTAHAVHKLLMFGIIAFAAVHIAQVIRAGWPSLRSMISGYAVVPAGGAAASDGAIAEPAKLGAPVGQSAAQRTVDAQTRRGFFGVSAAAAAGAVLLAVGTARDAGAESSPRPRRRRGGEGSEDQLSSTGQGESAGARRRAARLNSGAGGGDGGSESGESDDARSDGRGRRDRRFRDDGDGRGGSDGDQDD
jgi:thiosulfate reductase cytochrome b subunit